MGDVSEMRALIVLFTIIAVTISLVMLMPTEFFTAALNTPDQPSVDPANVIAWNQTYISNITAGYPTVYDWSMNGYNWELYTSKADPLGAYDLVVLSTYDNWWIFYWNYQYFKWYDSEGDLISQDHLGTPKLFSDTVTSNPEYFTVKNDRTKATATLLYNSSEYSSFADACEHTDFSLTFNINWEDRSTSMNALNLIGLILTGNMPGIHPYFGIVFGFISWGIIAASCYLAFIFVLRIVGAVFGGGGA